MSSKLKRASWFLFGLGCLIFFTILKLPREPIKDSLHTLIADALAAQGANFSASEEDLSFFLLPSYDLKKVTLTLPPPADAARVDQISISPRFLPLLMGRWGADIQIKEGPGKFKTSFSNRSNSLSASFQSDQFDLGRLGILPLFAGIQGSSILEGDGSVSTDLQALNETDGTINLRLTKISLEPQTIAGFALPKLSVSEALIQSTIQKGKAKLTAVKIGKPAGTGATGDDLTATITGEITLGKTFEMSTLNVKAHFKFSENILKSFMLLDVILGPGKQADGSYAYMITGSVAQPNAQPWTPGGGN